jgi:hypothetical protein
MGMHFGVIAAATSWEQLFAALRTVAGDFIDVGAVPRIEDFDLKPTDQGSPVVGGQHGTSAFLLDGSMILSGREVRSARRAVAYTRRPARRLPRRDRQRHL